jgi:ERCC4-related helicase
MQVRDYQKELFENCKNKNSIICLPTGTGKTFIAAMIMYNILKENENLKKKPIIFLACTRVLVDQQFQFFCEKMHNLNITKKLENDINELKKFDIICVTPQVKKKNFFFFNFFLIRYF